MRSLLNPPRLGEDPLDAGGWVDEGSWSCA